MLIVWQMESHSGRCYDHMYWLADVVAIVADGIATLVDGRCYCHCGRWNSHIGWNGLVMADVIALWQMEWPLG